MVPTASEDHERCRTAALLIIGNEVLSGKVQDSNSTFLLRELHALGVNTRRVLVLPDEIDIVAKETRDASEAYDYVFTTGGVGPTHDDVTFKAIAAAFGVGLHEDPMLAQLLRERFGGHVSEAALRMIQIPVGAKLLNAGDLKSQVCVLNNVYIFPGVPQMLKYKFLSIKEIFRQAPYYLTRIFSNQDESHLAEHLEATLSRHPKVEIGSYPRFDNSDYRVELTLESKERESLEMARDYLLERLEPGTIVRVINNFGPIEGARESE